MLYICLGVYTIHLVIYINYILTKLHKDESDSLSPKNLNGLETLKILKENYKVITGDFKEEIYTERETLYLQTKLAHQPYLKSNIYPLLFINTSKSVILNHEDLIKSSAALLFYSSILILILTLIFNLNLYNYILILSLLSIFLITLVFFNKKQVAQNTINTLVKKRIINYEHEELDVATKILNKWVFEALNIYKLF